VCGAGGLIGSVLAFHKKKSGDLPQCGRRFARFCCFRGRSRDIFGVLQRLQHILSAPSGAVLGRFLGRDFDAGPSVVGTLVWEDLGVISSIKWNSWFNFFDAGFAATTVGYSTK
jgi:hypothetical protein